MKHYTVTLWAALIALFLSGYVRTAFATDTHADEEWWSVDRPPAPVPRTGQTESYGPGDDGALQKGVVWPLPRFVPQVNRRHDTGEGGGRRHNGVCDGTEKCNGTVLDRLTRLVWLANADCFVPQHWYAALSSANSLQSGQCGLHDRSKPGDWRLPNIKELLSLIDYGCYPALPDQAGTGCYLDDPPFAGVASDFYWSSTTDSGQANIAWLVDILSGLTVLESKVGLDPTTGHRVWPVRGPQ